MPFDARDGNKNSVSDDELPEGKQEDGEFVILDDRELGQWMSCSIDAVVEVKR